MTDVVSFGVPEVDVLLGGGLTLNSTTYLEVERGTQELAYVAAFLAEGLRSRSFCGIILYDVPPDILIMKLTDLGLNAKEALGSGSMMIADLYSEGDYDPERRGPILRTNNLSDPNATLRLYYDMGEVAKKRMAEAGLSGVRLVIYSGSSAVANYKFEPAYKMGRMARLQMHLGKIVSLVLFNPKMFDDNIVAALEDLSDNIISLTVKEINGRYQRFIRVRQSPIPEFKMNEAPYNIVQGKPVLLTASTEPTHALKNQLNFNPDGTISLMGQRFTLSNARNLTRLMEQFIGSSSYDSVAQGIYEQARSDGQSDIKELLSSMNLRLYELDPKRVLEFLCGYISVSGLGLTELVRFDGERATFRVRNSLCSLAKRSDKPMNPHIAGLIAGVLGLATGRTARCTETKCVALGDDFCEFTAEEIRSQK
jgi:KaiC/GvpD/RAD55 family RecA-like ATPase